MNSKSVGSISNLSATVLTQVNVKSLLGACFSKANLCGCKKVSTFLSISKHLIVFVLDAINILGDNETLSLYPNASATLANLPMDVVVYPPRSNRAMPVAVSLVVQQSLLENNAPFFLL